MTVYHFRLYYIVAVLLLICCSKQEKTEESSAKENITPDGINETQSVAASDLSNNSDTLSIGPQISSLEKRIMEAGLIDVQTVDSTVLVDLKYSSFDNFVKLDLYGDLDKCYLQQDVAIKISKAQRLLKERYSQLSLLLYDGVRPVSVQKILWDTLQVSENTKHFYVAHPDSTSTHNFGAAVDLTLADSLGRPVDMGTEFDFFGPLAYPVREEKFLKEGKLSVEQVNNRLILRNVMLDAGFTSITTEWWHFNSCSKAKARKIYKVVN